MTEITFALQAVDIFLIPVVVGLVQVIKGLNLPSRFSPLVAIAFGIGLEALTGGSVAHYIVVGIVVGLSASGLYSGSKATVNPSEV